jgi:hypothetical protein
MTILELLAEIEKDTKELEALCEDMQKPFAGMIEPPCST